MPVQGFSVPKLDSSDVEFACYDIEGQDLGTTLIEGYVHGDVPIRLC